jgi:hypothetical protein
LRFSNEIGIRGVALARGLFVGGFATVLVMGLKGRGYPLGPIGVVNFIWVWFNWEVGDRFWD